MPDTKLEYIYYVTELSQKVESKLIWRMGKWTSERQPETKIQPPHSKEKMKYINKYSKWVQWDAETQAEMKKLSNFLAF